MKNLTALLTLTLLLGATTLFGQDIPLPKTGAKIHVENKGLSIEPNGEQTFDLWIVRSKRASKATFEMPKVTGPDEVNFTIEADAANPDHFIVSIKPTTMATGKYFYTVTSNGSGTQAVSGTTISVNVSSAKAVAKEIE